MSNRAAGSGVDLGTSPHGLSADRHERIRKHAEGQACPPSAKPVLTSPEIYHNEKVQRDCRTIKAAAAKQSRGFFGVTLTQEQCRHLAFAVLEQIESLEEGYEAHEPEVQDAIRCLCEVRGILKRAAKEHAVKTGNAKGGSTWRKDSDQLFDKEAEL
jgi:hypothetical protein